MLSVESSNVYPQLTPDFLQSCFDKEEALKKGIIIPKAGVNEEYDQVSTEIEEIEQEFHTYLRKYKSQLQCNLNFFGVAKNR